MQESQNLPSDGTDFLGHVIIATRKSPLAMWQSKTTASLLQRMKYSAELLPIVTTGDKMQKGALADFSLSVTPTAEQQTPQGFTTGKGLFVKEIQESLLRNESSVAVHSMKDLPVLRTAGLTTAGVLPRAAPEDVLILSPIVREALLAKATAEEVREVVESHRGLQSLSYIRLQQLLSCLPEFLSANVGTTSARRQALMKLEWGGALPCVILRGNVESRLSKVRNNEFGAILLAKAGLDRLDIFNPAEMFTLPKEIFIPAPAQGAIALECLDKSRSTREAVATIACPVTAMQVAMERLALWMLGGDCHTAIGAHWSNDKLAVFCSTAEATTQTVFVPSASALAEVENIHSREGAYYQGLFESLKQSLVANSLYSELSNKKFRTLLPQEEMPWKT